jgi:hypothetical protein
MEIKDVIYLVLGSNFIIALATFCATFFTTRMQIKNSERQFEKEFEKAIVTYHRDREWVVRSVPLLSLRNELSRMATRLNLLVLAVQSQSNSSDDLEKGKSRESQPDVEDWKDDGINKDFLKALNIQYDAEIKSMAEQIQDKYLLLLEYALEFKELKSEERKEYRKLYQEIKTKIPEVQELINKKLEEL